MYNRRNLKAYKTTSLDAELAVADPHRVIQMLMQGALERVAHGVGVDVGIAVESAGYRGRGNAEFPGQAGDASHKFLRPSTLPIDRRPAANLAL